jgi:hypothetical protein
MTRLFRSALVAVLLSSALAGCAVESVVAPDDVVQRAAFRAEGPSKITLFTVQSTRSGSGAHSGILINGSQRVLFDPAGTFYHPAAPEQNDVIFGITENVLKVYIDYHARETFDVIVQEVEVPPAVAERALAAARAYGPVPNAQCSLSVSRILSRLPGFESIPVGWFPMRTSEAFAKLPGATYRRITDDDADDNHGVLLRVTRPTYDPSASNE